MALTHINPESLDQNPVFSQGVLVKGGSLLVVGGQNGIDQEGNVVGTTSELSRLRPAQRDRCVGGSGRHSGRRGATHGLPRCAGEFDHGVCLGQEGMGEPSNGVSVIQVSGLARPDCLVEVSALALVS